LPNPSQQRDNAYRETPAHALVIVFLPSKITASNKRAIKLQLEAKTQLSL
jgi:hypothetical protein